MSAQSTNLVRKPIANLSEAESRASLSDEMKRNYTAASEKNILRRDKEIHASALKTHGRVRN